VELTVKDNGIGFDEKYQAQIFTIFQRLHSKSEYNGTGIGLALVKRVVEDHQGALFAKSEKAKEAAFHIILPVNGNPSNKLFS